MSLPAWECGLKSVQPLSVVHLCHVTPCVGVWIEILQSTPPSIPGTVTPCVGVWIEITNEQYERETTGSLPAWECGLKYYGQLLLLHNQRSLPAWECGLKSNLYEIEMDQK